MKHLRNMIVVGLAMLAGAAVSAQGQSGSTQKPNANAKPAPAALPTVPPDYLIGAADVLRIDVVGEERMSGDFLVRPDGKISMLQIDEIAVVGMTTEALKKKIKTELGRFFEEPVPEVFIQVKATTSRVVFVQGAVKRPGPYPMPAPMTIAQIITVAGGLEEFAKKDKILVISGSQKDAKGNPVTWTINYKELEQGKNLLKNNIMLNPGDTVIVGGGLP